MKTKRRLLNSLIRSYLLFAFTLGLIFLLVQLFSGELSDHYVTKPIEPSQIARPDYTSIDSEVIEESGGWVEILDEERNVIYIKGTQKVPHKAYSAAELTSLLYDGSRMPYLYALAPFKSDKGASLLCLVAIPRERGQTSFKLLTPPETISINLKLSYGFFGVLLLSVISVYLYGRYTSKQLTTPLEQISTAMRHMRNGHYDQRLNYNSNKELTTIQECFNEMADHLEQTERANQQLIESKQRMLLDISHDLKTPITTIQGYASALLLGLADTEEKRLRYLNLIYSKAGLMTELVGDLFELSKLETTEYPLSGEFEVTDLGELVREIIAENYEQFEQKNFNLTFSIPHEEIPLRLHKTLISRAVSNLLTNALKHNPKGTTVDIDLKHLDNVVRLTIMDNGAGIPESIRTTLFDPFVRGNAARTSDGGTGLGLSIAKKAVELHGGELRLLDTEGRTSFQITFSKTA
ncbi:HAMP domain-containing sensor histidine kinase [Paenibacillus sp. J22TS3]|uniref:HAMP domain-containing sensor histidine kinase n=1 Tax=Paenibacillus sp. J22TS3 TaxID=2807192 RepID=UPI001B1E1E7D|nr:HAMP domain-containing sensor histidine kinase [Paenibacillus sp. J22TS3]GIP20254.1 hypothetical protein J22TS3_05290 [Paenibacillus sp. J22TS3]